MSGQTIHNIPALKQRRRELRKNLTTAEAVLWKNLQGSRLDGKKFRRQHSVGKYVLDFYCPECRLAVELDGEAHFTSIRAEYDVARDEFIRSLKIRTIRFENRLVFENLEGVLQTIKEHLKLAPLLDSGGEVEVADLDGGGCRFGDPKCSIWGAPKVLATG